MYSSREHNDQEESGIEIPLLTIHFSVRCIKPRVHKRLQYSQLYIGNQRSFLLLYLKKSKINGFRSLFSFLEAIQIAFNLRTLCMAKEIGEENLKQSSLIGNYFVPQFAINSQSEAMSTVQGPVSRTPWKHFGPVNRILVIL